MAGSTCSLCCVTLRCYRRCRELVPSYSLVKVFYFTHVWRLFFPAWHLNNTYICLDCSLGRWQRATGSSKGVMSLFFFCDHSVEPGGVQLWQKAQLVQLCLLGCFSSKANSPLLYSGHFYFNKHLEIHFQYLTEPKLFWEHLCQFALTVLSFHKLCWTFASATWFLKS